MSVTLTTEEMLLEIGWTAKNSGIPVEPNDLRLVAKTRLDAIIPNGDDTIRSAFFENLDIDHGIEISDPKSVQTIGDILNLFRQVEKKAVAG